MRPIPRGERCPTSHRLPRRCWGGAKAIRSPLEPPKLRSSRSDRLATAPLPVPAVKAGRSVLSPAGFARKVARRADEGDASACKQALAKVRCQRRGSPSVRPQRGVVLVRVQRGRHASTLPGAAAFDGARLAGVLASIGEVTAPGLYVGRSP